jgi:hypothetical protein
MSFFCIELGYLQGAWLDLPRKVVPKYYMVKVTI